MDLGDFGDLKKNGNNEHFSKTSKRENQLLFFVFTKFPSVGEGDDLEFEETEFQNSLKKICKEFQYSHEKCPKTAKLHFQGQMILMKKMRRSQVVKFKHLNMYLAPQKGSQIDQDLYINKCTEKIVKWSITDDPKSNKFTEFINFTDIENVINMRNVLIDKLYKDKDTNMWQKGLIELCCKEIQISTPKFTIGDIDYDASPGMDHDFVMTQRDRDYRRSCINLFKELERTKISNNMIEKFLR